MRPLLVVGGVLLAALVALVLVGARVLDRDRVEMYERDAHDRQLAFEPAVRALESDISDIGDDLDLAATLVDRAEAVNAEAPSTTRELDAIATIKREYVAMAAMSDRGANTRVVALDAPPGTEAMTIEPLRQAIRVAGGAPDPVHVLPVIDDAGRATWYRVFARRPKARGTAVAIVVDLSLVIAHANLSHDPDARLAVIAPDGRVAPGSTLDITGLGSRSEIASLLRSSRDPRSATVSAELARTIGLGDSPATAIAIPAHLDGEDSWTVLVVTSTRALDTQERTLVRRVLIGSFVCLVLLGAAAAYVAATLRRTAILRERVRHVDRLAVLTEKAEKIVENIPCGVMILSEGGRITSANRWFADHGGSVVAGRSLREVFARDAHILDALIADAAERGEVGTIGRVRFEMFGRDLFVGVHVIPFEHAAADTKLLVVFEDLTHQIQYEERLLRSEKLATAGQLAAGIAHEISTPLSVALGRIELASAHLGADHPEQPNHRIAVEQIDRVTRLIKQLLEYVRPSPSRALAIEVGAMLDTVVELLNPHARKRSVSLTATVESPMLVRADPDHIQQILINLALNAIDACEASGEVQLRASRRDGSVVFEVQDDGHGIAPELQAQVFDPFFTTKKRGQGTGLGLWVVAQLVRANAGEIELRSTPELGTHVRLTWPVPA